MTSTDDSLAAEHERLLEFLYVLPLAVVDLSLNGDIQLMNPHGASLLARVGSESNHTNLFRWLAAGDRHLARDAAEFVSERGVLCTDRRIELNDDLILALTLVKAGSDRVLATFRNVAAEVRAERAAERDRQEQRAEIRRLSTPIIEAYENTLVVPVIGVLDAERADALSEDLLTAVIELDAAFVLLDFGGLREVDEAFAAKLQQVARALALVGCRCVLAGVTPPMALAMASLDRALGGLASYRTVRDAASDLGLRVD